MAAAVGSKKGAIQVCTVTGNAGGRFDEGVSIAAPADYCKAGD